MSVQVHVSIHDVSPVWEREVETALAYCAAIGSKPALLVVPDMHHRGLLREHPAYCERLRALAADGHEVYLHGYHHAAAPAKRHTGVTEALRYRFAQRVMSAGEAEFAELDAVEGEALLARGLADLKTLGVTVQGFVPPAWARRGWLLPALAREGVAYTEDQLWVYQPVTGARRFCPAINYASRTLGRRWSSVAYARLARMYTHAGLSVRLALHPADLRHPLLVNETVKLLAWARGRTTDHARDLFG